MSQNIAQPSRTEHAWLVLLGEYARQLGLIQALNGVPLQQKVRTHRPQTKVIEFLVAILAGLPYMEDISRDGHPLDVAFERFHTGKTIRHSVLVHFGQDPVTTDLPGWFTTYNDRQTIEAGIKEGKAVFQMHHLKVRSTPALWLQEQFAAFAANFVRWADRWLDTYCRQEPDNWATHVIASVKTQVQVAAHTPAFVDWLADDCLLTFTDESPFAGCTIQSGTGAFQLCLPLFKTCDFDPFLPFSGLIAQKLR